MKKVMIRRIRFYIHKLFEYKKFGKIKETVKVYGEGGAWEIEYTGHNGKIIGYWAYGNWDPNLPYPGSKRRINNEN